MRSSKPHAPTAQREEVQDFIAGAEQQTVTTHPWDAADVRPDINKVFNLRLPEDMFLKLKYLSENQRRRSMQSICLDAIEPYIEQELKKVLSNK